MQGLHAAEGQGGMQRAVMRLGLPTDPVGRDRMPGLHGGYLLSAWAGLQCPALKTLAAYRATGSAIWRRRGCESLAGLDTEGSGSGRAWKHDYRIGRPVGDDEKVGRRAVACSYMKGSCLYVPSSVSMLKLSSVVRGHLPCVPLMRETARTSCIPSSRHADLSIEVCRTDLLA